MKYEEKHEYVLIDGKKHYVIHPRRPVKAKRKPRQSFRLGGGL